MTDLLNHFIHFSKPDLFTLQEWIGAVNTGEWTAPFRLKVQHPSLLQITPGIEEGPVRSRDRRDLCSFYEMGERMIFYEEMRRWGDREFSFERMD
jgi:hypothetical protein